MSSGTMMARGKMTFGKSVYLGEGFSSGSLDGFLHQSSRSPHFPQRLESQKDPLLFAIHGWRDVLKGWLEPEQCKASLEKELLSLSVSTGKSNEWIQMSPVPCSSPLKQGGHYQDHYVIALIYKR